MDERTEHDPAGAEAAAPQGEGDGQGDGQGEGELGAHAPGERVGLGRVLEDRRPPTAMTGTERPSQDDDALVEEASEESFPASDPPTFMSGPPTSRSADRDAIEAPRPDEVP